MESEYTGRGSEESSWPGGHRSPGDGTISPTTAAAIQQQKQQQQQALNNAHVEPAAQNQVAAPSAPERSTTLSQVSPHASNCVRGISSSRRFNSSISIVPLLRLQKLCPPMVCNLPQQSCRTPRPRPLPGLLLDRLRLDLDLVPSYSPHLQWTVPGQVSKNVTVAEVIELGLERFGILEGVVDGGDEVEDKFTKG